MTWYIVQQFKHNAMQHRKDSELEILFFFGFLTHVNDIN